MLFGPGKALLVSQHGSEVHDFHISMGMQKLLLDLLHAWQKTKTKTSNNLSRVLNCMYHFALLLFASASAASALIISNNTDTSSQKSRAWAYERVPRVWYIWYVFFTTSRSLP